MRLLITTFSIVLALSQFALAQGAPPARTASPLQGVSTLAPLVKKVMPNVVNIAIRGRIAQQRNPLLNDPFFRRFFNVPEMPAEREIRAAGSGVIVDARRGLVITNNHVVEHSDEISVTLSDGRRFQATLVGADADTDVAVIKIPAENLVALPLRDSDKREVGDFVVAIGNPFGLGQTVTSGIVSALRRSGLGIKGYEDFIQTDAPINPGNSGGALIDLHAELIGINTAIIGPSGGNVGIRFAIPSNMVRDVLDQLVKYGQVRRGQLGVTIQDLTPDIAQALGLRTQQGGAVIAGIEPGSPAERAGLKAGDVITEIGKSVVHDSADLRNKVGLLPVGETTELTILRGGRSMIVRATLTARSGTVLQGGEISPLLEGASFAAKSPNSKASGVEVVAIQTGSTAWAAGLRMGDVVVSVNQEPVAGPGDFAARVKESPKRLLLNLLREGRALFIVLQA
jgi:serine protease Do/serine protease DegQ